jgi:peptidyl-tRNA hydrolase, PTH1 family
MEYNGCMVWGRTKPVEPDWVIAGLGNPGGRYAHTRHNAGWWALDELERQLYAGAATSRYHSQVQYAKCAGAVLALVKPTTFMNLSGECIAQWLKKHPAAKLLVLHDDLDLPCGKLRLREDGSSGGHKGIQSIIDELGRKSFLRLKIGIGAAPSGIDPADWVLDRPLAQELELLHKAVKLAAQAVTPVIEGRLDDARHLLTQATEIPPAQDQPGPGK